MLAPDTRLNVSVIVPAYNSAQTLPICIESLTRQTYPAQDYEVIIVNDGSTDATVRLLSEISLPPNFRVLHHATNRGLASARNSGIRQAQGEILIFLDADMVAAPDFIARHVQRHTAPQIIGILSAILPAEPSRDKYQRYLYEARRGARRFKPDQPLPFQVFLLGCTSVKRSALAAIGLFLEELRTYGGEDTEFAYRLWQRYPAGLFFDPQIRVYHHHHRTLNEALRLVENFGRTGVPQIIARHPALSPIYLSNILPTAPNRFKRLLGRCLIKRPVNRLLWHLYYAVPYPLSNVPVRFLMAAALLRGLSASR